jgi:hypothetical protein
MTQEEIVADREDYDWERQKIIMVRDDRSKIERERLEAEQQRKNAVYNQDLFIKIVQELMAEGKSLIEMMVYLDVDEAALTNAFTVISQREQVEKLNELRSQNKIPGLADLKAAHNKKSEAKESSSDKKVE